MDQVLNHPAERSSFTLTPDAFIRLFSYSNDVDGFGKLPTATTY